MSLPQPTSIMSKHIAGTNTLFGSANCVVYAAGIMRVPTLTRAIALDAKSVLMDGLFIGRIREKARPWGQI